MRDSLVVLTAIPLAIIGGTVLLMVMGLPMLVMAATIRFTSRGPVLYRQTRLGYQGRAFELLRIFHADVGA